MGRVTETALRQTDELQQTILVDLTSVDTSKPAIDRHFKTGH
jgi:hypothetical protein